MNNNYFETGRDILKRLNDKGFEAYFVGGAVRDKILNLPFDDIDICTSASPDEIKAEFPNHKDTGLGLGTVTVLVNNFRYEVTTFRVEEEYKNNRKPKKVHYSKNLSDDLNRRDFTINALAMTYGQKIVDLHNGLRDIEKGTIKAIGNPKERFNEDALRILRAFRFISKLDFKIESKTLAGMKNSRKLLRNLSNDRVMSELTKIFEGKYNKKAISLMVSLNIHKYLDLFADGLKVLSKKINLLNVEEAFALCFKLNEASLSEINLSTNTKNKLKAMIDLSNVTEIDPFDEVLVFTYGKDVCISANKLNLTLKKSKNKAKQIEKIYNNLPIKDLNELMFKPQDILTLTHGRSGPFVGEIMEEIKSKVLKKELQNDHQVLKNYVIELLEEEFEEKPAPKPFAPISGFEIPESNYQEPTKKENTPFQPYEAKESPKPVDTRFSQNYDTKRQDSFTDQSQKYSRETKQDFYMDPNASYEDRLKMLESRVIQQERELKSKDNAYDELQKQVLKQKYEYEREKLINANIEALEKLDYIQDGYQKAQIAKEMQKVVKQVLSEMNHDYKKLEE
ncbi:MAG TPA: CCA tRNA nucleotidyltransferase [Bacilli bacterium]|nr:CCA tRNA nucleotidyltransferase [Bacilli bacterium]